MKLSLLTSILLFTISSGAETLKAPSSKKIIPNALQIAVSYNGQRPFNFEATQVLAQLGIRGPETKNEILESQAPLGQQPNLIQVPFVRGLMSKTPEIDKDIYAMFDAYIEDPNRQGTLEFVRQSHAQMPFRVEAPAQNDLNVAVDRGLINRILQLSYLRGNFNNMIMPDGSAFTLKAVPTIDRVNSRLTGTRLIRIQILAETTQTAYPNYLTDTVVIGFSIIGKLEILNEKTIEIVLQEVDLNTVSIDSRYIKVPDIFGAHKKIRAGLREHLKENLTKAWHNERTTLPNVELDMLPAGLRNVVTLQDLSFEPTGHLILNLNFVAQNLK